MSVKLLGISIKKKKQIFVMILVTFNHGDISFLIFTEKERFANIPFSHIFVSVFFLIIS